MRHFDGTLSKRQVGEQKPGARWAWLVVLALSWIANGAANAAEGPHLVSGRVLGPSGDAIAGVLIETDLVSTRSDLEGRFSLLLASGETELRIEHSDFRPLERWIVVGKGEVVLELRLLPSRVMEEMITVGAIRAADEVPVTKTNMAREEIERLSQGQDMPALLQYTPSMTWYSDSGTGSNYSYFSLRGIHQTRINMTLDGAPLNDPAEHALYFNNFGDFASTVDSIQVQRGVGTSTVGSPAFGGSVNFASRHLAGEREIEVRLGLGSFESRRASVAYESGRFDNGLAFSGRFSFAESDGYRDRSGTKHDTFFFNAAWQGEVSQLKLVSFSGQERSQLAWYAVDPQTLAENPRFNPFAEEEEDRFGQDFVQLQYSRGIGDKKLLTASFYYNGADGWFRLWDDSVAQNELMQFGIDQHFVGSTLRLSHSGERFSTDVGLHFTDFRGDHTLDIEGDRIYLNTGFKKQANAFLKVGYDLRDWHFFGDAQIRWAEFDYQGDIDLDSVDWTFFDPKIGARYSLSPRASLYASIGKAEREPTRLDLLSGEDNATIEHDLTAVRPEEVIDLEMGLNFRSSDVDLQVSLYSMDFENEIAATGELSDIGLPLRVNVDESYRRGLEIDLRWAMTGHWTLTHNSSFSRNQIREWEQFYDVYDSAGQWIGSESLVHRNVSPLLTPEIVINQGIEWSGRVADFGAMVRWVDDSYLDNTEQDGLVAPSFLQLDLRGSWRFDGLSALGRPKLIVHVNNLLDREDNYPSGYSYQYFSRDEAGGDTLEGLPFYYPLATRSIALTVELTM